MKQPFSTLSRILNNLYGWHGWTNQDRIFITDVLRQVQHLDRRYEQRNITMKRGVNIMSDLQRTARSIVTHMDIQSRNQFLRYARSGKAPKHIEAQFFDWGLIRFDESDSPTITELGSAALKTIDKNY